MLITLGTKRLTKLMQKFTLFPTDPTTFSFKQSGCKWAVLYTTKNIRNKCELLCIDCLSEPFYILSLPH